MINFNKNLNICIIVLSSFIGILNKCIVLCSDADQFCDANSSIDGCSKTGTISDSKIRIIEHDVLVFTVATEQNDGYLRYAKSAKLYGIPFRTLGMGEKWQGGNMDGAGGGHKISLLRDALKPFKGDTDKIILFTDSYDVVFLQPLSEIVKKFKATGAKILFGAESFCWPNESLADSYPKVELNEVRYLNSGLFIGYASNIYEMLKTPNKHSDDDQLYYTKAYLNEEFRNANSFKLDNRAEIFQNLNGAKNSIKLEFEPDSNVAYIVNSDFETKPSLLHGNGPSKMQLNSMTNYLIERFDGNLCVTCSNDRIELDENNLPVVTIAVFVESPMPFFEEFLDKILTLNYPKTKINLFIHGNVNYHKFLIAEFVERFSSEYSSVKQIQIDDGTSEAIARDLAVQQATTKESDYLFVIDSDVHLDNPDVLRILIKENRNFISPLMTRPHTLWSNFWGALSESGYYARSNDYMDIVNNQVRGIWNVPFVSSCYLIRKDILSKISFKYDQHDPDMALCHHLRKENIFMNIINLEFYGHLINGEQFNTKRIRPDFYMLGTNQADWEQRYIHPEFIKHLDPNQTMIQPCPDVFWFPIATEKFCDDMVAIMEDFGKWSDGSNEDKRLEGGYEAVPTRDIHMNQVGLEPQWLNFLKLYIRPLQEKAFLGYFHDPPRSLMNFVVRYKPDEQPLLRPHHDSSTYTINIALNNKGSDFEGGGCRFLRYNCSVESTKKGWMLMHPGRLTHFHEGLRVTAGIRYIMISFVDP